MLRCTAPIAKRGFAINPAVLLVTLRDAHELILLGGLPGVLGVLAGLLSRRIGAPMLLVFLAIGMLAGKDGVLGVAFDDYSAAYLMGSAALAVILFAGGLKTPLAGLRRIFWPAAALPTIGVAVTTFIVGGLVAHFEHVRLVGVCVAGAIAAPVAQLFSRFFQDRYRILQQVKQYLGNGVARLALPIVSKDDGQLPADFRFIQINHAHRLFDIRLGVTGDDGLRYQSNAQTMGHEIQLSRQIVHLETSAAGKPARVKTLIYQLARAPVWVQIDECLVHQVLKCHVPPACEPVLRRTHRHQRLACEHPGAHARRCRAYELRERKIELASADALDQRQGAPGHQADFDMRTGGTEPAKQVGNVQQRGQPLDQADRQRAAVQALHIVDDLARRCGRRQHALRLAQECSARWRYLHAPRRAKEQGGAEFLLQRPDRGGEARLDHMQTAGRAREILLGRDGDKILELSQIHGSSFSANCAQS